MNLEFQATEAATYRVRFRKFTHLHNNIGDMRTRAGDMIDRYDCRTGCCEEVLQKVTDAPATESHARVGASRVRNDVLQ